MNFVVDVEAGCLPFFYARKIRARATAVVLNTKNLSDESDVKKKGHGESWTSEVVESCGERSTSNVARQDTARLEASREI